MTENGLTRTLRNRAFYLILLACIVVGVILGWYVTTVRTTCARLVTEQQRLAVVFGVVAEAAVSDGDNAQAQVWRAYAAAARDVDYPRC